MARIKLTKNELKRQKDSLKRFERYLPTLELKKKQIQSEINKIRHAYAELRAREELARRELTGWVDVFGENVDIGALISLAGTEKDTGNIAGVDIPVFVRAVFRREQYDIFKMPLWVDRAVAELEALYSMKAEMTVLETQIGLLAEELRVTTQRVNLFDKIKIPESKENIRVIRISLGDEQTAGVVRGKIAKSKLMSAQETL